MSLLLINPNREIRPVPAMPVGLLRVAEAAERDGVETSTLDLAFARRPRAALSAAIRRARPALIGFTVRNLDNADYRAPRFYLEEIAPLVAQARAEAPGVPIVVGGPGASIAPDAVREYLGADSVVVGPGEGAIEALHAAASSGGALEPVVAGPAVETAPAADYARWLDLRPWRAHAAPLPIQSRRGCPRACVYCNYATIDGTSRYALGEVDAVVEATRRLVGATGIRHVEFVDSTFNSPPSYTVRLCEALTAANLDLALGASGITPRFAGREVLEAMRAAGFKAIWCSPDAASEATIASYGKGFSLDDLYAMVTHSRDLGFVVMWSFMFGGPGETEATTAETLRFIREVVPPEHPVMLTSRMRIYAGTALADVARAEGMPAPSLDPRDPGQFYLAPGLDPSWLDATLIGTREALPNVMTLDAAQGRVAGWLQRLNGLLGRDVPTWADYAPIRRNVMRMLGRA